MEKCLVFVSFIRISPGLVGRSHIRENRIRLVWRSIDGGDIFVVASVVFLGLIDVTLLDVHPCFDIATIPRFSAVSADSKGLPFSPSAGDARG